MQKTGVLFAAKLLVSAGLIGWLLANADVNSIANVMAAGDITLLVTAFLMYFVGYLITAGRWRLLLAAQGIEVRIGVLVQSFAIGVFFNNILPSTIGGDAFRMYDSWRFGANKSSAVSIILVDRVLGLSALLSYALIASLMLPEVRQRVPFIAWVVVLAIAAIGTLAWLVFGPGLRLPSRLKQLLERLPAAPLRLLERLASGFRPFRSRHDVLLKAVGLSALLQLNVIVHFILIALALGIGIPWSAMFVIIPVALLLMLLPVSINGIGVREAVFVYLFGLYAVSSEQAIAFAWVSFGMILAQGMIGGLVFVLRRSRRPDAHD